MIEPGAPEAIPTERSALRRDLDPAGRAAGNRRIVALLCGAIEIILSCHRGRGRGVIDRHVDRGRRLSLNRCCGNRAGCMARSCGESKKTDSYTEGQNPVTGTPIAVPPTPTAAGRRRRCGMPAGTGTRPPEPASAGAAATASMAPATKADMNFFIDSLHIKARAHDCYRSPYSLFCLFLLQKSDGEVFPIVTIETFIF